MIAELKIHLPHHRIDSCVLFALLPARDLNLNRASARTEFLCNDHFDRNSSRYRLLFPDRGRVAAERKERRLGCGFRRSGQPDGLWSTGRGVCPFPCDDLVRDHFHDHVNHAFNFCSAAKRPHIRIFGCETDADEVPASDASSVRTADRSAKPGAHPEVALANGEPGVRARPANCWTLRLSLKAGSRDAHPSIVGPVRRSQITIPGRDSLLFLRLWWCAGRGPESPACHRAG